MADVNDIVVLGFGSWSTVNQLPTLGFGIGVAASPTIPGMEYRVADNSVNYKVPDNSMHYRASET